MSEHEKQTLQAWWSTGYLSGGNMAYLDNLYENYLQDPASIPPQWRATFDALPSVNNANNANNANNTHSMDVSHQAIKTDLIDYVRHKDPLQVNTPNVPNMPSTTGDFAQERKQAHVMQLIHAYRLYGHLQAKLDPLGMAQRNSVADLTLQQHNLSEADNQLLFATASSLTNGMACLADIVAALHDTYCRSIGIEYLHVVNYEQITWLQQRIESTRAQLALTAAQQQRLLADLTAAEGLEKYLGSRYVGQKRFSLEGGDSLIPLLKELIERAASNKVEEVILGMAHRGRLNVLVNVLGKAPGLLFQEFEGHHNVAKISGDVKYHNGFSSDVQTANGIVHLMLAFNPSHLEIIAPVVEGSVRARQWQRNDLLEQHRVIPVLIHGDAAFAGQGVVMETFCLSQARGYCTGGTVHIVVNNQIGFTTSNPHDARSTAYCTDVAKMVNAPILHVNGDDPEAVIFTVQLAFDFRMRFKCDVVIDLVCYRRHGHNEADEPSVTQPNMYEIIKKLETTRQQYAAKLIAAGIITSAAADNLVTAYRDALDKGDVIVQTVSGDYAGKLLVDWHPYIGCKWDEAVTTKVAKTNLMALATKLTQVPAKFTLHPAIKRLFEERDKMTSGDLPLNWGYAETLAYATLLEDGYLVRLSGQDSGRGTFAHRHAVLYDYHSNEIYIPLQNLAAHHPPFNVIDSILSEEAVLGFEYGYATASPDALVIWEAQFGDFANGAQVVIDQFISSGEQKWGRLCGLVMLLPHGFEGQGPEHSSARLERYMQLCAQHNLQVCVPTTPAQIFHLLRRQMLRPFRKPLIVMTPKSLLRHKLAVSQLNDLTEGQFSLVIPEIDAIAPQQVRKVVMCSGKVYYDLLQQRRNNGQQDVAIIRIEQLYPFPRKELRKVLDNYAHVTDIVWCQEEPKNQGVWFASQHNMYACLKPEQQLGYVGRGFFAAPAVGNLRLHLEQQVKLVTEALG